MKVIRPTHFILILGIFLASCNAGPKNPIMTNEPRPEQLAVQAVVTFLDYLHNGRYQEAAEIYGGTYEIMIDQNPSIDPEDHAALLQNACAINGAQCLDVYSAGLESTVPDNEFWIKVELLNEDGTQFVQGPCCGGNETDFPPQSTFIFTVIKNNQGKFKVVDMPPYLP